MGCNIHDRLAALREELRRESLDAFIFPSADPHGSEYVPDHWKCREYMSGFGGSAGTLVVTAGEAALWTDSRYFIAAAEALRGTGIALMREGIAGTPSIVEWLGRKLAPVDGAEVGIDGMVASAQVVGGLVAGLRRQGGITLRTNFDPLARIWPDRPPLPSAPIWVYPEELAGESAASKLGRIRRRLKAMHVEGMLLTSLDDIAWALNLCGSDIHCNPVFVAYLLFEGDRTWLFAGPGKVRPETWKYLQGIGVENVQYADIASALASYSEYNILMDPATTCHTLYNMVKRAEVVAHESPVAAMKAVKNATEIDGFRRAMERDGVAMVRFLRWLRPAVEAGGQTELTAAAKLESLRELELSAPSTSKAGVPQPDAPQSDGKLSYEARKEQARAIKKAERAVAESEARIEELESSIAALEARLATPEGAADTSLYTQYADLKKELSDVMDRWTEQTLELEELRN